MDPDRLQSILANADNLYEQAAGQTKRSAPDAEQITVPEVQQTEEPARRRAGPSAILINSKRQKRNPVIGLLRWHSVFENIEPDFVIGASSCVLFLQLKYHRLHPEYIGKRIERLNGKQYALRVLMLKVDQDDKGFETAIKELTRLAMYTDMTLIVVWNDEDAAKYMRNMKAQETAKPTPIMGQTKTSYEDQLHDVVTSVKGVNKNNATTLVSTYGSLRNAILNCEDSRTKLDDIIGWGPARAKAFTDAINAPFVNK